MATQEASRVEVPKPQGFSGKWEAKELDNFLWHMDQYFKVILLTDEVTKVRTATLYLTDTTALWWRRRFANMEKGFCTIETWEDFKREIKKQFYLENVAYLARKNMRCLKHTSLMQLLGALQVNPKPSTPKTSLLSGVQVNEAKEE